MHLVAKFRNWRFEADIEEREVKSKERTLTEIDVGIELVVHVVYRVAMPTLLVLTLDSAFQKTTRA